MLQIIILIFLVSGALPGVTTQKGRPSQKVLPRHYQLEIVVDLAKAVFQGKVWIKIECQEPLSTFSLNSDNLDIKSEVKIWNEETNVNFDIKSALVDRIKSLYSIIFKQTLQKGQTYILYIPYEGTLQPKDEGLIRAEYLDTTTRSTKFYAVTKMKTIARYFFPCFDEPSLRATFSLKVGHLVTEKVVSNMAGSTMTDQSGQVWTNFPNTPLMSPHQVALIVSNLDVVPLVEGVQIWGRKEVLQTLKESSKIISLVPSITAFYKNYFDGNFPLPNLNLIILPYAEYIPLYGVIIAPEEMVLPEKIDLNDINKLAHDIASNWIGGMVSIKWWDDFWYSWALSEHMATLALDKVLSRWDYADRILRSHLEAIYKEDVDDLEDKGLEYEDYHVATPLYQCINSPVKIFTSYFAPIFLNKGPVLMRMVHMFLGDQVFQQGLRKFLKSFNGESAEYGDLWMFLTEEAHNGQVLPAEMTVQEIMDKWIKTSGFPVLMVTKEPYTGHITVSQRIFIKNSDHRKPSKIYVDGGDSYHFLNIHDYIRTPDDHFISMPDRYDDFYHRNDLSLSEKIWWVPVTISGARNDPTVTWLSRNDQKKSVSFVAGQNDWAIFNNRLTGIYRVNYDIENWKLIADALNHPDHSGIDMMNRIQLLSDALDLANNRELDYQTAFTVIRYLRHERSYLPWKSAFERLKLINENLFNTYYYDNFKAFMKYILTPVYDKFKDLSTLPDEVDEAYKAAVLEWACKFGVGDCNKDVVNVFIKWRSSNGKTSVPKYMRQVVYCKGIEAGTWEDWKLMQKYFYTCQDTEERQHILHALSCTKNETTLNSYLDWSIDEDTPSDICFDVFREVAATEDGWELAWRFLSTNVDKIKGHSPQKDTFVKLAGALITKATNTYDLRMVVDFMDGKKLVNGIYIPLERSCQVAKKRFAWVEEHVHTINRAIYNIFDKGA